MSATTDALEQEADRIAEVVTHTSHASSSEARILGLSQTALLIQAQAAAPTEAAAAAPTEAADVAEPVPADSPETAAVPGMAPANQAASAGLIVDDEARELGQGQMRKGEFLDELRAAVCAAADAELAAVGRTAEGCPYISRAFERYRRLSSSQLERGLRRYAPQAAASTAARDYMPAVSERVRRAVALWAATGQVTGVPEELAGELGGAGLLGSVGGILSGIGGAVSSLFTGIGGIFFKAREGGPGDADPQEVRAKLGSGHSLDSGIRSRMESAFGHDFSRVRVHTDTTAAALSTDLNARAFTIGSDIAFGAGEYRPGSLTGDALIAHELAHVVQQAGAGHAAVAMGKGATEYDTLEEDADRSAVGAMVSVWGGAKRGLASVAQNGMPRLKSGLGLQRCGTTRPQQGRTQTPGQGGTQGGTATNQQTPTAPVPLPRQILNEVNAQRGSLGPLRWNNTLAQSAATYCGVMTSTHVFSHTADGGDPLSRVRAAGYFPTGGGGVAGENLYQNPQAFTATEAVTWWMNSPPHRAEIMRPQYEEGGVAVCDGSLTINGRARQTNIAVIHFGGSHPVMTVSNPTGTRVGGSTNRWTITGSVSDNVDPPPSITVKVTLVRASRGMTVSGLPTDPLTVGADGAFSFTFETSGTGTAEIRIGAADTHGNSGLPETRNVRVNRP